MPVQAGLCQTCSETTLLGFPRGGSNETSDIVMYDEYNTDAISQTTTLLSKSIASANDNILYAILDKTNLHDITCINMFILQINVIKYHFSYFMHGLVPLFHTDINK